MSSDNKPPFRRSVFVDDAEIVGVAWWHEALALSAAQPDRRRFLRRGLVLGGAGTLFGVGAYLLAREGAPSPTAVPDDLVEAESASLALQRAHGWNVGAEGKLAFEGALTGDSADPQALARLAVDLAPRSAELRRLYVPTLFEGARAKDATLGPTRKLADELVPVLTDAMRIGYSRGRAFASLLADAPPGRAVLIDLPGPEAVAFAAGLAPRAEPVFLFDNWPHPQGLVPAHMTLAAAARLQPLFVTAHRARPQGAPAAFVLDRNRLAGTTADGTGESSRFDNRYIARAPDAAVLQSLWVREVLYVGPKRADPVELDDLNGVFVEWRALGIRVRFVAYEDFAPAPRPAAAAPVDRATRVDDGDYYYGGAEETHWAFYVLYDWGEPRGRRYVRPIRVHPGWVYTPVSRASAIARAPARVGRTYYASSRASGRVHGVAGRGGSWARVSGSSGA